MFDDIIGNNRNVEDALNIIKEKLWINKVKKLLMENRQNYDFVKNEISTKTDEEIRKKVDFILNDKVGFIDLCNNILKEIDEIVKEIDEKV